LRQYRTTPGAKISWAPAHKLDLRECAKTYKQAINASLSHPRPLAALAIDFISQLSDGYAATPEEKFLRFSRTSSICVSARKPIADS
jgi:hypothetical protein